MSKLLRKVAKRQFLFCITNMDPNFISEYDAIQLNIILLFLRRYVIIKFPTDVPESYQKWIRSIESLIASLNRIDYRIGSGPTFTGNAIYNACFALLRASLNSTPFQTIINELVIEFEEYKTPSPEQLALESDDFTSTGSESSISELSPEPVSDVNLVEVSMNVARKNDGDDYEDDGEMEGNVKDCNDKDKCEKESVTNRGENSDSDGVVSSMRIPNDSSHSVLLRKRIGAPDIAESLSPAKKPTPNDK